MPSCVLRYCFNSSHNTNKSRGVTFHQFPCLGREEREKWVKFVQNNRSEETWLPSDRTCVCSLHFRDEDKYTTKAGRRFLKKSAVPCIDVSNNNKILRICITNKILF
ncbi:THAP domain-containing protein 5-like [Colias croceus]|uniref:THAP domain-containing protein 5-like n=1 Tax=Colias crocea TaxID=72248 RepID=UPI001E27B4FA|nr:THAP domain-containing protein 5-like [Colias croceus]